MSHGYQHPVNNIGRYNNINVGYIAYYFWQPLFIKEIGKRVTNSTYITAMPN